MKRIILSCTALVLAMGLHAQGQFTVSGKIQNAEGQKVKLFYGTQEDPKQDSTVVKNGTFTMKGKIDNAYCAAMLTIGKFDPYSMDNKALNLYLEPNVTSTVDADANAFNKAVVKGGKVQSDAKELAALQAPARTRLMEMNKAYYAAQTPEEKEIIGNEMEPYSKFVKACADFFVATKHDSYIAAEQMLFLMGEMKYEDIKKIYDAWTPAVQQCDAAKEVKGEIDVLSKVRPGCPAPDFTATDINGKPFTLSSLKGKVVIIDFWASWCKPCRASNPHMRELYGKYHDKGFDLVYVSDDDSAPDKWRKAVKDDQLVGEGYHHVLRGMKEDHSKSGAEMFDHTNDISDKYAIHFLPTKYLIDKKGNIICKIDERNEGKLDEMIEKAIGGK